MLCLGAMIPNFISLRVYLIVCTSHALSNCNNAIIQLQRRLYSGRIYPEVQYSSMDQHVQHSHAFVKRIDSFLFKLSFFQNHLRRRHDPEHISLFH
ncbi:MAG: hypothetical protein BYD32DRAFT_425217 [Podila humilis]|nr:MAG: hypothetical protein BYD32DRAFT_425217 [Podila humilis]